jgi:hypothetical protein
MIRLTWRQFRTQAELAFGAMAATALVLAVTGPHLLDLYRTLVANCDPTQRDCASAATAFLRNDGSLLTWLGILVIVVPGIIGIFWGAPLVAREIEAGTYRLAWTQSVTRSRWLVVKLGLIGLAGMAVAGLFSLMVGWWASPLDRVNMNRFSPGIFDQRGIVPIGYAAFAFALGVTAGVLIRRTLPAMATTFIAFVGARLTFILWARPHLMTPTRLISTLDPTSMGYGTTNSGPFNLIPEPPHIPNAWMYSTHILDKAGHALSPGFLASACPSLAASGPPGGPGPVRQVPDGVAATLQECVAKLSAQFHEVVTYQPAAHYWAFQALETAIFIGLALVLAGFCIWWVRRRLT